MITNIPMKNFLAAINAKGIKCTLLGIGPVSEIVTRAALEASKNYNCPAIFVASRNQVDLKSLGHGYLMGGMDQKDFVKMISSMSKEIGFKGPVYICRDHGGPWQRNVELDEKYPLRQAMEIAKQSFYGDIEAGFNYLHIDPTKCPIDFKLSDICDWTIELLKFCEDTRKSLGKDPIDYEVGTEDIQGGLTTNHTFEKFLADLTARLKAEELPLPTCIVAQTGTLLKIDRNVGRFNKEQAKELVGVAAKFGIGLKEHNGDYLDADSCSIHPDIGITAMNVAPEFGLVETEALLHLAGLEQKLVDEGQIKPENSSNLKQLFLDLAWKNSPWIKWMTDDIKKLGKEKIEKDTSLRLLIARVCGHYVYNTKEVISARKKLYANVNNFNLADNAERFVIDKVRNSIEFYMKHFRLKNINAEL